MKKVFAMAIVMALVIASAGFAAPAASSASDANKTSWGFIAGTPTIQYNFTKDFSGQFGFTYTSASGGSTTTFLVEGSNTLMNVGSNDFTLGGLLTYGSFGGGTSWTANFTCGVRNKLNSNVELQFLIYPIAISNTSFGGASSSTTSILGGATIGAHLYL